LKQKRQGQFSLIKHPPKLKTQSPINTFRFFLLKITGKTEKRIAPVNPVEIATIKLSTTIL
jgi:hypothetical protein